MGDHRLGSRCHIPPAAALAHICSITTPGSTGRAENSWEAGLNCSSGAAPAGSSVSVYHHDCPGDPADYALPLGDSLATQAVRRHFVGGARFCTLCAGR